jgi:hypothetical protein
MWMDKENKTTEETFTTFSITGVVKSVGPNLYKSEWDKIHYFLV